MKRIAICVFPLLLLLSSCGDPTYGTTAKIGLQEWFADEGTVSVQGQNGILINAHSETLPPIILVIGQFANTGTFALDSATNFLQYGSTQEGPIYCNKTSRPGVLTITVTEPNNKRIAGTFSATLFTTTNDSVIVSEGKFDVTYQ